jgi:hypothetical protein
MDLSGTNAIQIHGICSMISEKKFELMRVLSSSGEGMMNKKPRKQSFWSLERSEMGFLMKPSSLENGCQRSN